MSRYPALKLLAQIKWRVSWDVSQAVKKKQTNKKPTDVTIFATYQCNQNFRKATSAKQNTKRKKIRGLWLRTWPITPVLNVGGESEETHCSLWWNLKLMLPVRNYKPTFSQYDTSIYVHTRKPTSTHPHSTILKATWSLRCFLLGRETSKLRLGKRIQKCQVTFIQLHKVLSLQGRLWISTLNLSLFLQSFPSLPPKAALQDTAFWNCYFARLSLPQDCECLIGTDMAVFSVPSLVWSICFRNVPKLQWMNGFMGSNRKTEPWMIKFYFFFFFFLISSAHVFPIRNIY